MFKYFGIGLVVTAVASLIGYLTNNWELSLIIIAIAGLGPLFMAGFMTGAFVSGDRNRANYHTESQKDRIAKNQSMKKLLLLGAPNLAFLIILVILAL
ncbi:DUF5316 domain-containing protein [Tenuibacillus multivorans]|uniref:Uncharacterized protein n=1 Tax=Tenuibacillus multivorans TaxID=237069 RepID=A0A1G9WFJ0_9BACI|nr:DUF5316 domain-containing protein [Tenuibacillus multivorans]GEL76433.1 hypothetical protein TMU01_06680 [Tenuibacillus multivorans]SDM83077.1 hypothetical protein SAMN05216498_0721 [Tenuibacillus multivorans]